MKGYALTFAVAAVSAVAAFAASDQPYAGQEVRDIASLSASDVDDLLNGRGWGFALPAELNGYPGPTHLLDLADALDLSVDQRARIEAIRVEMAGRARALGADFVAAEAALDAAFEAGTITLARLAEMTARSSEIEAELRAVHLAAHLQVRPLLSRHQVAVYGRLRGYGAAGALSHGEHGGH